MQLMDKNRIAIWIHLVYAWDAIFTSVHVLLYQPILPGETDRERERECECVSVSASGATCLISSGLDGCCRGVPRRAPMRYDKV